MNNDEENNCYKKKKKEKIFKQGQRKHNVRQKFYREYIKTRAR